MTDFRVVPDALWDNVNYHVESEDAWERVHKFLTEKALSTGDTGLLGDMIGFPKSHNNALQACLDKLEEGRRSLEASAEALRQVASAYALQDFTYFKKFGYIDNQR